MLGGSDVNPRRQPQQLHMINLHRGVFALQRTECKVAAFQTLLPDRKSVTVPGEHFDTATPAIEEQNQMLGQQLDSNSTAKYPATIRQRPLKIFRMSVGLVRRRREKSRRQRSQCVGLSLHLNNCSQNPPQQSTVDACVDPERRDAGSIRSKLALP